MLLSLLTLQCSNGTISQQKQSATPSTNRPQVNSTSTPFTTISAIQLPEGYSAVNTTSKSFANYLPQIPLKESSTVYLYNGTKKANQLAQYAVLNISVGNKDLQQCADAVMRLRAEYLYSINAYDRIIFYDNDKVKYAFTQPYTRQHFDSYLLTVFGMCGTASLAMQLKPKANLNTIEIGDVFIKGGFPGHAVIIVQVAINDNGDKIFMLAQSYMPAQDIHILNNPNNTTLSPWYAVADIDTYLYTPEYTFTNTQLKSWD